MKKFFAFFKGLFGKKNEVIDLFPADSKVNNAELGGNYCGDVC